MLIPIGQVNSEVRRLPWVTIVLLSLNTLVFGLMTLGGADKENSREVRKRTIHLVQYWQAHPYLELPKELSDYWGTARASRIRKQIDAEHEKMRKLSPLFPEPEAMAEEQKELARRGRSLVEAFQASSSYRFGFVPGKKTAQGVLFSMFMHGGWMHLLGNMLFLFITAPFLEDVFGRPMFAGFYLVAGVVAAFAHAMKFPDAMTPLIGASGAIAGVMGAFLIRLGQSRIKFLCVPILFLPFIRFTFALPAFVVLPFWFLEQLIWNWLMPDAGVAWWAHIGGFLFGMAFALVVGVARIEERFIHPSIEKEIGWQQHPGLTRAGEARAAG
ncbi:MAG: rhomboid family intramembrane serine protease, partial [Thermoanaerobaculia bacterium]